MTMTPCSEPVPGRTAGNAAPELSSRIAAALLFLGESYLGWHQVDRWLATWVSRAIARRVQHEQLPRLLDGVKGGDRLRLLHLLSCGACRRQARRDISREVYDEVAVRVCQQPDCGCTE
jgi:hypothetical protein